MIRKIIDFARPGIFPLVIGLLFLILSALYYALNLPDPQEIQQILRNLFARYGFVAVFFAAFLEAFFVLSFYFPGSLVIVLSVLAIESGEGSMVELITVVAAGALLGVCADYALGRWGLHHLFLRIGGTAGLEKAERWQTRWGSKSFLFFGFHPNFLSLLATHAGIARVNPFRVIGLCAISLVIWTPIMLFLIARVVNDVTATSDSQHWYVFGFFMIWAFALMLISYFRST